MIKQPITLPPNKQWSQPNTGFLFGSVYSSRNVAFDVPGVVSLSRRMEPIIRQATSGSDLNNVLAIAYGEFGGTAASFSSTEQYIVVTDDELFLISGSLANAGVLTNASTPSMSDYSDGISWNDGFYCTTNTNLSKLVSGTWTGSLMSITGQVPHPLCASASANYLLVGNNSTLKKRTVAGVNSDALTLPSNYQIVWIRSDYSRTLIGARAKDGTSGAVFEWDEVAPTWTNKYDLDFSWPYSGCFRNTDFFVVSDDGRLLKYNGGGFSTVAQWPIYKSLQGYWEGNETNLVSNPVYQRSMAVVEGRVVVNLSGEVAYGEYGANLYENFPGGVWDFSEETGLTHRWGATVTSDSTDFAQMEYVLGSGAVFPVFVEDSPPDPANGSYLITGARLDDNNSASYYTIQTVVSTGTNVGQVTTTRVETADIADDAKKVWCKFRGVYKGTDLIRFKYKDRMLNGLPFEGFISWASSTVFTSTDVVWASAAEGYEVTVTSGLGAGCMRHIASVTEAAGTYTVTLDEAIPGAPTGSANAICDNFLLLSESITSADDRGFKEISIPQTAPSTWIQLKAELRGSERVTIEEVQLVPASDIIAQP